MSKNPKVAILSQGNHESLNKRFGGIFAEFEKHNFTVEPIVYQDGRVDEIRNELYQVDGVLVWVNPIEAGRDRTLLDNMLRDVASKGVFVSTHPDVILKMGTKEVLFQTREMDWSGGDIHLYKTAEEFREQLPARLANGLPRVLKQNRGNNGIGVWRVEMIAESTVLVLHAERDSTEKVVPLSEFLSQCEVYFEGTGQIIDQPFHSPVPNGMVRCYMTRNEVVGFGHQYVTALLSPPMEPKPRIYHPDSKEEFQALKVRMESEWIPALQKILELETDSLPVIWDADFLYGEEEGTFVLCEINVSSVYPFPDSALPKLVKAAVARIQ